MPRLNFLNGFTGFILVVIVIIAAVVGVVIDVGVVNGTNYCSEHLHRWIAIYH